MVAANATPYSPAEGGGLQADRLVLLLLIGIACLRSLAIIATPLEIGVDEAQYWLWSQQFDFGYFTKPPLTSWIIGLSHSIFGHHQWAVRIPAPWLHLATALVLWRAGGWLGGPSAGRLAALLWSTLPAVGLGGFLISTDTPLLLFWSLGLMIIIGITGGHLERHRGMVAAGAAFGAALMAKYAAVYGLLGLLIFVLLHRFWRGHNTVSIKQMVLFCFGCMLLASPNLVWNISHDFATVRHLGENANLTRQSYDIGNSLEFLGAQFLTAGPLAFALMLGILRLHKQRPETVLLFGFSVPAMAIITLQAFLSEANANWALTAMPALVLWLSVWGSQMPLSRLSRVKRNLVRSAILVNGVICTILVVICWTGQTGPLTPHSDPLRRLRGWQALAADTQLVLDAHGAQTVIADRRASAALLNWHLHGRDVDVLVHDHDGIPSNHFEANHPWTPQLGRPVVVLHTDDTPPSIDGISWDDDATLSDVRISSNRSRSLYLFTGLETDQ
tara:strand:+ start:596 stop:2101 length:1506 start_codon:yes stop_codon:yes gene_type:complete